MQLVVQQIDSKTPVRILRIILLLAINSFDSKDDGYLLLLDMLVTIPFALLLAGFTLLARQWYFFSKTHLEVAAILEGSCGRRLGNSNDPKTKHNNLGLINWLRFFVIDSLGSPIR